jgi:hypothetical protein
VADILFQQFPSPVNHLNSLRVPAAYGEFCHSL